MKENRTETLSINGERCYRKTIDQTTYVVRVHFNQNTKETMRDKIIRSIREEVNQM